MSQRPRYAIIGTGSRAQMYLAAMAGPHADVAQLVAASDSNPGRLEWSLDQYDALREVDRFTPDALADVIAAKHVDRVIVTTPDFTHAKYIVAALNAGADVIVEKPLTVNEAGVRAIAEATKRTGRHVTITFNYRYAPRNAALRQVIADGDIGTITSVHFEWVLDTAHGADYFRRWHRYKDNSGGLLIHKASHHFDLVNWWIADSPVRVFASGGLRFYGRDNAERWGLTPRPERGTTDSLLRDSWCLDLRTDPTWTGLYLNQEHYDGYLRDRDVFGAGITIEDNMSLVVDYATGASMSYSLNAHCPWEGYTVCVNGSLGRAELKVIERGRVLVD
ncbi:MAG: Gfo/Idh/MocA family oxidoreductase, partial [Propionibacteriaceae bacterium]|nr:Gfo/Idh/MocA family oxidoreductase [Propionibacteriaceae bacterium]